MEENVDMRTNCCLDQKSKELRTLILNSLGSSGRGHLGPALSILEIVRVLYDSVLVYDPKKPNSPNRDRFILSKGHGCLALYAVLVDRGFIPKEQLMKFCSFDGILGGHPESETTPGVEFSTGSLGHGLSVGVGIAVAARMQRKNWRTFVLLGDGELNEGSIWEAALHASKHRLGRLCVIIDNNQMQAWGRSSKVVDIRPLREKWESFNFDVFEVDGHNLKELENALAFSADDYNSPRLIIANTIKGKGIQAAENSTEWHHKSKITKEEIDCLLKELNK